MNIHLVIYDAFLNDLYKLDDEKFIQNVCECLYKCLQFFTNIEDSKKVLKIIDKFQFLLNNQFTQKQMMD